jgi:hypothetical protein
MQAQGILDELVKAGDDTCFYFFYESNIAV